MRPAKKASPATTGKRKSASRKGAGRDPLRPRKLPRQERATATVAAILEAAACILESGGFDAYTTNAIAERAGASIGSLYQYFPNKTALTQALIAREKAALLSDLTRLLDQPKAIDLLPALIQLAVTHQLRRPALARLLDAEEARLPPSDEAQHLHDVLTRIFRRCLGDALIVREPYVPQDLFAIIQGMVDTAGQRGEDDEKALIKRVERAVFGYIDTFRHGKKHAR